MTAPFARQALAAVASLALSVRPAAAQYRASEHGIVGQTVNGTSLLIEYNRPQPRGRPVLFGRVVKWGETWTPGANWATTLETDRDVRLEGQLVPKGKYSVWMIPREQGDWTLVLAKTARRFHESRPPASDELMRVSVTPRPAPHTEMLSWTFSDVSREGAVLHMQWGTTDVPVRVAIVGPPVPTLTAAERASYVGTYHIRSLDPKDTALYVYEVLETPTGIRGRATPALWKGIDQEFDLIPAGPHRFRTGIRKNGQPYDMEEIFITFTVVNGRATGFEEEDMGDVYGRAVRVK